MNVMADTLWTQKAGCSPDECEDAATPNSIDLVNVPRFRAAAADGATEASYSKEWATLLVAAYSNGSITPGNLLRPLRKLSADWRKGLPSGPLPWYAEEKVARGSFSTLLGITFFDAQRLDGSTGTWQSIAVGDTCLFHIRRDSVLLSTPYSNSADFENRPYLICTNTAQNKSLSKFVIKNSGTWLAGDRFYLMTDALAAWFLKSLVEGNNPWQELSDLQSSKDFETWVATARLCAALKNDDCTLVRVDLM